MGGDSYRSSLPFTGDDDDVPFSSQDFPHESSDSSGEKEGGARVSDSGGRVSSAAEKHKMKVYADVLRTYEDLQPRIDRLEEAKNKILRYTPGSWADKANCSDLNELVTPKATSLLLIGPKASGKSSLVNKISRIFEDHMFLPPRSQVSCSSSPGDGTYFLQEYMIPRNSRSFCLYDTRGLSPVSSENVEMIKRWMRKGLLHGELITRSSDSILFQNQLMLRAQRTFLTTGGAKPVDFILFIVNGLSVLESMDSTDETKKDYSQMIAANFNIPALSFKDYKPAVVVTHGDLMSVSDRVRVRVYLGELLGVPPVEQIFDIPEDNEAATTLAVFDMLIFCLDRADRNLHTKLFFQVGRVAKFVLFMIVLVLLGILHMVTLVKNSPRHSSEIENLS